MKAVKVEYLVSFTYNNGMLGSEVWFGSRQEAEAFVNAYKYEFEDANKMYYVRKIVSIEGNIILDEIIEY